MVESDGVEQFWRVVDMLEKDEVPSDAEWNALFTAPGYAYYFTDGRQSRSAFEQLMRLVFMPSSAAALRDSLANGGRQLRPGLRPLHALIAAKNHREELEAFRSRITAQNFTPAAARRAAELLPDGALRDSTGAWDVPDVQLGIYNLDGRGPGDFIVVDLVLLYLMEERGSTLFVSHEFHHAGRVSTIDHQAYRDDPRHGILLSIDQIQSEGVANLIDKPYLLDEVIRPLPDSAVAGLPWTRAVLSAFGRQRMQDADATPETLQRVDSLLVRAAQADADGRIDALEQHADAVRRAIPNNGHPNGYFMASLIAETLGTERLAETANDPFAFVRLYNEAAQQSNGPAVPLSQEAMSYLARLEAKYAPRRDA
jgi:hypothetical protein